MEQKNHPRCDYFLDELWCGAFNEKLTFELLGNHGKAICMKNDYEIVDSA